MHVDERELRAAVREVLYICEFARLGETRHFFPGHAADLVHFSTLERAGLLESLVVVVPNSGAMRLTETRWWLTDEGRAQLPLLA